VGRVACSIEGESAKKTNNGGGEEDSKCACRHTISPLCKEEQVREENKEWQGKEITGISRGEKRWVLLGRCRGGGNSVLRMVKEREKRDGGYWGNWQKGELSNLWAGELAM